MAEMKYRFQLDLPPTPNQAYRVFQSRIYLTREAKLWKEQVAILAWSKGFHPDLKATYAVGIWLFVPDWDTMDVDAVKLVLDAIIGERVDHRVVSLMVHKVVEKGAQAGMVVRVRSW